jgi:hypothetical protein
VNSTDTVIESMANQIVIKNQNDLDYCVNFCDLDSKITDLINNSNDTELKKAWILSKSTLKYAEEKLKEIKNDKNKNEETPNKKRKRDCEEDFPIFDADLIKDKLYKKPNKDEIVLTRVYQIYINKKNITNIDFIKYRKSKKFVANKLNINGIMIEGQTKTHIIYDLIDNDINKLRIAYETIYKNLDIITDFLGISFK